MRACILFLILCAAFLIPGSDAFSSPDTRTLLVADFFTSSDGVSPAFLRDGILSSLRRSWGAKLHFMNDQPGAVSSGFSLAALSSDDTLHELCESSGAGWIIFGSVSRVDGGLSGRLYMYDHSRGMVHLFTAGPASSEPELLRAFTPALSRIGFVISSAERYFLHSASPLFYVRDLADYGFTGDRFNLNYPYGLFMAKGNRLLCAASGTVSEWDSAGRVVRHFGRRGGESGEYTSSMKVAADDSGTVYVSDMSGKIILYPQQGIPSEIALGQVPSLFAVSGDGVIFICDKSSLRLYDRKGKLIRTVSLDGDQPYAVAQGNNRVLMLVSRSQKIVLRSFTPSGGILPDRVLPLREDDVVITSFREDSEGNLYILDMGSSAIVKLAPDDSIPWVFLLSWAGPSGQIGTLYDIAVAPDGKRIYIADSSRRRVLVYGEFTASPSPADSADLVKDADLRLASWGEILRRDPMNTAAVERYLAFYDESGAYSQALDLCRKYQASIPSAQKIIRTISVKLYLRDADGFAALLDAALRSGDRAYAEFYYEESLSRYDSALALSKDQQTGEKRGRLVDLWKKSQPKGAEKQDYK
jgi:DNA-binding beta-propeller fold protein YncE